MLSHSQDHVMTVSEAILKPVTQKSKLVYGCLLCKRNLTHTHSEEPGSTVPGLFNGGIFNKPRAIQLEQLLRQTFFPREAGPILTYRKRKS